MATRKEKTFRRSLAWVAAFALSLAPMLHAADSVKVYDDDESGNAGNTTINNNIYQGDQDADTYGNNDSNYQTQTEERDNTDSQVNAPDSESESSYGQDRVGDIEASDVNALQRRKKSRRFATAGLGPATFSNVETQDVSYNVFAGGLWEVNPYAAIKALGDLTSDLDQAVMMNAQLGANFYMLPNDISPYVGGTLGLGFLNGDGGDAFGFDVGASIGALLFRTSSTQMNIEAQTNVLLDEAEDNFPVKYAARIGIVF